MAGAHSQPQSAPVQQRQPGAWRLSCSLRSRRSGSPPSACRRPDGSSRGGPCTGCASKRTHSAELQQASPAVRPASTHHLHVRAGVPARQVCSKDSKTACGAASHHGKPLPSSILLSAQETQQPVLTARSRAGLRKVQADAAHLLGNCSRPCGHRPPTLVRKRLISQPDQRDLLDSTHAAEPGLTSLKCSVSTSPHVFNHVVCTPCRQTSSRVIAFTPHTPRCTLSRSGDHLQRQGAVDAAADAGPVGGPPQAGHCQALRLGPARRGDGDRVVLAKLALEQALGQGGLQLALHRALDRPRSKDRVKALGLRPIRTGSARQAWGALLAAHAQTRVCSAAGTGRRSASRQPEEPGKPPAGLQQATQLPGEAPPGSVHQQGCLHSDCDLQGQVQRTERNSTALSSKTMRIFLAARRSSTRLAWMRAIFSICARCSAWKTMKSSILLTNSGRKCCRTCARGAASVRVLGCPTVGRPRPTGRPWWFARVPHTGQTSDLTALGWQAADLARTRAGHWQGTGSWPASCADQCCMGLGQALVSGP